MKKDLTELVFLLDMSGSMEHLTDDTIGGFNSVLKEHAAKEGDVLVTTYLFNNESRKAISQRDRFSANSIGKKLTDIYDRCLHHDI